MCPGQSTFALYVGVEQSLGQPSFAMHVAVVLTQLLLVDLRENLIYVQVNIHAIDRDLWCLTFTAVFHAQFFSRRNFSVKINLCLKNGCNIGRRIKYLVHQWFPTFQSPSPATESSLYLGPDMIKRWLTKTLLG